MTAFPNSPHLLKAGLVLIDPPSGVVKRVIALQYNPDSLSRSFQIKGVGAESGDRSEALRLKGPPVETFKIEAEIDATDQLENPGSNPNAAQLGIQPQLAVLELLLYPSSAQLQSNNTLSQSGTLEILPMETPLTLFVWSRNRVVPVRVTEFSVTEEAFDPSLNPIRAKVNLGMRVLNVDDLGFGHRGGGIYMAYQQQKEQLGARSIGATLIELGLGGIP